MSVAVPSHHPLLADLDEVVEHAREDLLALRGSRLYVTGGTGFIGTWTVLALLHAHERLGLHLRLDLLVRNPDAFRSASPWVAAHPDVQVVRGDVRAPVDADVAPPDAVIHAATPASAALNLASPTVMIDTVVEGMRSTLAHAARNGAVPVLFTSSGAVYGRQPPEIPHVTEEHRGGPDPLDPGNAYHEAKRLAELLGAISTRAGGPQVVSGRLFAFLGPGLPLDAHFAAGNFLRDALAGGPVVVGGDGTPYRSYQYPSELVVWLLALLVRGQGGRAYNVGSEEAVSIAELARAIARRAPAPVAVEVRGTADPARLPERYVPSTARARGELGVPVLVDLDEAIVRTLRLLQRGGVRNG